MTVCRGTSRVRNLIESEGMAVDLTVITYNTARTDGQFLIKYEGEYHKIRRHEMNNALLCSNTVLFLSHCYVVMLC